MSEKCRENVGKRIVELNPVYTGHIFPTFFQHLLLQDNVGKMLLVYTGQISFTTCWRNVGKRIAELFLLEECWKDVGKKLGKCWKFVAVVYTGSKIRCWKNVGKMLEKCVQCTQTFSIIWCTCTCWCSSSHFRDKLRNRSMHFMPLVGRMLGKYCCSVDSV